MTSIKVKFRPARDSMQPGRIAYQVIHDRKPLMIASGYRLYAWEWNKNASLPADSTIPGRMSLLTETREGIRQDMEQITRIIHRLENSALPFSTSDIVDEFSRYTREFSLFGYMERKISDLQLLGKMRSAEIYRTTLNSFRRFRQQQDVRICSITAEMLRQYEASLWKNGISPNTSSFYMRVLRAVYNRAAEEGSFDSRQPFRHVYTGIGKTIKRALPITLISQIRSLKLSCQPKLDYARDMFMMSFFLRGMSFIDMAFLRKSDLSEGHITYRRRKTGQQLTVGWTSEMQAIIDKYPCNPTQYLLPIITRHNINERQAYRNASFAINTSLKKVAALVDSRQTLTMYCARHSWASVARAKGVPLSIISEGMGHDSEATTKIYLASLDTAAIDDANSMIIGSV